uniref:Uncharacterized protein n=1 Tax=virus sp. ctJLD79 TaxID=2827987 RepID=A0A8S5RF82_9VIRU|nr:MAG TPA: hypothetical protein [virus sp. ctJLD79]
MRHHVPFRRGEFLQRDRPGDGLRHADDGPQRVPVAGVQLLSQQDEGLALGQNGVRAGRVGVVDDAHVHDRQPGGGGELSGRHAHFLHMGRQTALSQLAEDGILAGLRVGGGRQKGAHIGLEFLRHNGVILLVGYAEEVFLGRGVELQRNGGVGHRAHIVVDQRADWLFQPGAPEGLSAGGVPHQRLHQRPPHPVGTAPGRPAVPAPAQDENGVVGVEVHHAGLPPGGLRLVPGGVHDGKAALDAPLLAAPQGGGGDGRVKADAAFQRRIRRQRGEHAAVFQLAPARLGILRDEPVALHQLRQQLRVGLVRPHKAVKHGPGGQHIHGLLAPAAPHLQIPQPRGEGNAQIDVPQGHMALVIFFLCRVGRLMAVEHVGQIPELLPLRVRQAVHPAEVQRCQFLTSSDPHLPRRVPLTDLRAPESQCAGLDGQAVLPAKAKAAADGPLHRTDRALVQHRLRAVPRQRPLRHGVGEQTHRRDDILCAGLYHGVLGSPHRLDALDQHIHTVAAVDDHAGRPVIALTQPVCQPPEPPAAGLKLKQRDAGRAVPGDHRPAEADRRAVGGEFHTIGRLALRLFRVAGAVRPRPGIQRLVALFRQDGAPPAQALPGKAVGAHAPALLRRELLAEPDAHGRVGLVPERVVFQIDLVHLLPLHRPLVPGVMCARRVKAGRPSAAEHVAGTARIGRRAGIDQLAGAGGRCGQRGHDGLHLVVRQLLRLVIDHQRDAVKAAGRLPGTGGELNAPAVQQLDALLAVGVADVFHQLQHLRVPLVREHPGQSVEALFRRAHLMGGVQDLFAVDDHTEELPPLQTHVLAVLPGHGQPGGGHGVPPGCIPAQPAVQHQPLPFVQRIAVGCHQRRGVRTVGREALRLNAIARDLCAGHASRFRRPCTSARALAGLTSDSAGSSAAPSGRSFKSASSPER